MERESAPRDSFKLPFVVTSFFLYCSIIKYLNNILFIQFIKNTLLSALALSIAVARYHLEGQGSRYSSKS